MLTPPFGNLMWSCVHVDQTDEDSILRTRIPHSVGSGWIVRQKGDRFIECGGYALLPSNPTCGLSRRVTVSALIA
jgi:hypothetical protein